MTSPFLDVAVSLAETAGKMIVENFQLDGDRSYKGDGSVVTETDLAINRLVVETLSAKFPNHSIVGEEQSLIVDGASYAWVCDPIDGTMPFTHGLPLSVFSLALCRDGLPIVAVVKDPYTQRLYVAEKGNGSTVNDRSIWVSDATSLKGQLIDSGASSFSTYAMPLLITEMWDRGVEFTRIGSAVNSGALVACGQYLAHIYAYANPWDGAAIKLLVEEAGGRVTDLFGVEQRWDMPVRGFVASNGHVHDELIGLIAQHV